MFDRKQAGFKKREAGDKRGNSIIFTNTGNIVLLLDIGPEWIEQQAAIQIDVSGYFEGNR